MGGIMDIIFSAIHHVLLYKFDEIPLARLIQRATLAQLTALFEFSEVHVSENNQVVNAINGVYRDEFGDHPINRLVIEERRILIDLVGSTRDADQVMIKLKAFLANLAGRADDNFLITIVKSEESEIIAKLNFSAERLFAPELLGFLQEKAAPAFSYDFAKAVITPAPIPFLVQFKTDGSMLDDYRISLSRKELIIGPRPGYPLFEQVYYSKAPTSTDIHTELLLDLESRFK
jgi:hypothetical protein